MIRHDRYCDGFAFAHLARERQTSREGRGMWRAVCELCGWQGSQVGPDARSLAQHEADAHTQETACTGQCSAVPA